jgi:hypothetical protein
MPDLRIKVDKKDYALPDLDVDQWLKIIAAYEKAQEKAGTASLLDADGINATVEFYFLLLHDTYPELTRNKLKKMPLYQLGVEFSGKVFMALTEIPLDSASPKSDAAQE